MRNVMSGRDDLSKEQMAELLMRKLAEADFGSALTAVDCGTVLTMLKKEEVVIDQSNTRTDVVLYLVLCLPSLVLCPPSRGLCPCRLVRAPKLDLVPEGPGHVSHDLVPIFGPCLCHRVCLVPNPYDRGLDHGPVSPSTWMVVERAKGYHYVVKAMVTGVVSACVSAEM